MTFGARSRPLPGKRPAKRPNDQEALSGVAGARLAFAAGPWANARWAR